MMGKLKHLSKDSSKKIKLKKKAVFEYQSKISVKNICLQNCSQR